MNKKRLTFNIGVVSIIIPSYNRKRLLDECINFVINQSYKKKEIIVIDDNSEDGTYSFIKNKYPSVKVIKNKENKGASFAKNQGIAFSSGEFLLFLDSDAELVNKNSILNMVRILNSDERIGEIGGEINLQYPDIVFGQNFKNIKRGIFEQTITDKNNRLKKCGYIPTSNCMIRKKVIYSVGGFDPYYGYPGEDTDLGYRLIKRRYKNVVSFDCGATHKCSNISRLNRNYTFYRATTRLLIKYFGIKRLFIAPFLDFNECFFMPIIGFFIRKIKRKKVGENFSIGAIEPKFFKRVIIVLFSPYHLFKAYLWNLAHIKETINSRNENFLEKFNNKGEIN